MALTKQNNSSQQHLLHQAFDLIFVNLWVSIWPDHSLAFHQVLIQQCDPYFEIKEVWQVAQTQLNKPAKSFKFQGEFRTMV